nr:hypothetical protein [Gemmobacter aquarius]
MHQLDDDLRTILVHGIAYLLPPRHMRRIRDAGLRQVCPRLERILFICAFRHDQTQPAPRAAGVIGDHLVGRRAICIRHLPRQRRHSDPVAQGDTPKRDGREQGGKGFGHLSKLL